MKRVIATLAAICCCSFVPGVELSAATAFAFSQPLSATQPLFTLGQSAWHLHGTWRLVPRPSLRQPADEPLTSGYVRTCPSRLYAAGESNKEVAVTYGDVLVREWDAGDLDEIRALLATEEFDPEGPVSSDCGSAAALSDAYNSEDGCCFLVATASGLIVGTAALASGTQVTNLPSGASVSKAGTVGALRRAAVSTELSQDAQRRVWNALLPAVERRAVQSGCVQLLRKAPQR